MKSLISQKNKRGQALPVLPLVMGIASLAVAIIIALVITSTLKGADLLTSTRPSTTVTNETGAWLNISGYTLDGENGAETLSYTITKIWTNTPSGSGGYNSSLALTNATVSDTGIVYNATLVYNATVLNNVSISYTYLTYSDEEFTTNNMSANFSSGINNISGKIPTILLIAAIIMVLSILAVLIGVWYKLKMGGSSSL